MVDMWPTTVIVAFCSRTSPTTSAKIHSTFHSSSQFSHNSNFKSISDIGIYGFFVIIVQPTITLLDIIHYNKKKSLKQLKTTTRLLACDCYNRVTLVYSSCLRLANLPTYYVPKDGPLSSYREYVSMLPNNDHPEAFGQHPNADITSQIQETRMLFETLLSLQPQVSTGGGDSQEDRVCQVLFE